MSNLLSICEIFSSIQGEGMLAGRRQIFIRLTDCNLDCAYCDTAHQKGAVCHLESTPGSNIYLDTPQQFSLEQLVALLKSWCSMMPGVHHSISITGGEPLLSVNILAEWLPELRKILPLHLETNGSLPNELNQIVQHLDYISMDIKLPSVAACSRPLWELHRTFLQISASTNVSVKLVVGQQTSLDEIRQACEIITSVHKNVPLFVQPLTLPDGTVGITAVHLLSLQESAASILPDVRVIPQMHKLLGVL
jgi:7-carboxy-7-deazaguanine synthase